MVDQPERKLDTDKLAYHVAQIGALAKIVEVQYRSPNPGLTTWRTAMDKWERELLEQIDEYRNYRGL